MSEVGFRIVFCSMVCIRARSRPPQKKLPNFVLVGGTKFNDSAHVTTV